MRELNTSIAYTSKDLPIGFTMKNGHIYVNGRVDEKDWNLSTGKKADENGYKFAHANSRRQVLLKLIADKNEANKQEKKVENFKEYGLRFLIENPGNGSYSSQKDKIRIFEKIISPYFSAYKIKDITDEDVATFLYALKDGVIRTKDDAPYSGDRCAKIKRVFKNIIDAASYHNLISPNPFLSPRIAPIKFKNTSKKKAYTKEEVIKIISRSEGWLKVFLNILFLYAPRPCEVIGLKWEDIDFENNKIYIRRAITKENGVTEGINGNKNHNREITAFTNTIKLLNEMYLTSAYEDEYIFVPHGRKKKSTHWFSGDDINRNYFQPFLKEIGVAYKTMGSSRNSAATLGLSTGLSFAYDHMLSGSVDNKHPQLKATRKMLGHSDNSKVTVKHYYKADVVNHDEESQMAEKRLSLLLSEEEEEVSTDINKHKQSKED